MNPDPFKNLFSVFANVRQDQAIQSAHRQHPKTSAAPSVETTLPESQPTETSFTRVETQALSTEPPVQLLHTQNLQILALDPHTGGASGLVSRGLNVGTGQRVAIKRMRLANPSSATNSTGGSNLTSRTTANLEPTAYEDMEHEFQTMQELDSVLKPTHVLEHGGSIFAIMPLMPGSCADVRHLFADNPRQHQMVVRQVILQTSEQLTRMHRRGYVHRDIKPANIMRDAGAKFHLGDYGGSAKLKENQRADCGGGTDNFAAPELLESECTPSFDVWSLGMTAMALYTQLPSPDLLYFNQVTTHRTRVNAGQLPRETPAQTASEHLEDDWDECFAAFKAADPQLYDFVVQHMLVHEPHERASLQEVASHMHGLCGQLDKTGLLMREIDLKLQTVATQELKPAERALSDARQALVDDKEKALGRKRARSASDA